MAHDDLASVPLYARKAWGAVAGGRRGPKPKLSFEAIVQAGVDLASEEGLPAVSMAQLSARLGVSPMALYRHIESKEDLLTLMVDHAFGPAPGACRSEGWRPGLQQWAEASRDAYRRHPWILRVPIRGLPLTPNQLAWMDDGLGCLADTGLPEREKLSCLLLLTGFVQSASSLELDLREAMAARPSATPGSLIRPLIASSDLPALKAAIESGAMDPDHHRGRRQAESEFEFELSRVLDGIGVLVDTREAR